jgi:hypothetical protein
LQIDLIEMVNPSQGIGHGRLGHHDRHFIFKQYAADNIALLRNKARCSAQGRGCIDQKLKARLGLGHEAEVLQRDYQRLGPRSRWLKSGTFAKLETGYAPK